MVIQTPRLCNDVAFQPPQKDHPNTISCSPVISPDEVEDYEAAIRVRNSAIRESEIWAANGEGAAALEEDPQYNPPSRTVGDIVIGAHTLVPEGKKIELSAIVGGGKETYIDTVADSGGRMLTKEQMAKLGLKDARAIEELRKELEKIAAGKEWKLDVIETPKGKEYRGIIEQEEDESQGEDGKDFKEGEEQDEGSDETYKEEL